MYLYNFYCEIIRNVREEKKKKRKVVIKRLENPFLYIMQVENLRIIVHILFFINTTLFEEDFFQQ